MRQFITDTNIFAGIVVIGVVVLFLPSGQSTIEIQLHDTYFVIDKISMTVLTIGPLTFLIFLPRALTRKFNSNGPNIGLIIGLTFVAVITFCTARLQQGYLNEMMRLDDRGLPDGEQFIGDVKKRINWTWGLFGFWVIGLLLLALRTIKVWRERYSS